MSECWADGELRAYLDGELGEAEEQTVTAHLRSCAACSARHSELAQRALRVSNLMAALPEPAISRGNGAPARSRTAFIAGVSVALAAALAVAFLMLPKHTSQTARQVTPHSVAPAPEPQAQPGMQPAPLVVAPAVIRRKGHTVRPAPVQRAGDFMKLDNEPIETGTIVRVGLENSSLQAEFVVGPDGRAHAVRILGGNQR